MTDPAYADRATKAQLQATFPSANPGGQNLDQVTISFGPASSASEAETLVTLLQDALDRGSAGDVCTALAGMARAQGMIEMPRANGLGWEALDKAIPVNGNPSLSTLLRALHAMQLKLSVVANPP